MKIIDSHQHFWHYDPVRDAWIDDTMTVIRRDFLTKDLSKEYKKNNIDGSVVVQADQSTQETDYLLELCKGNEFVKGVVGWVNLTGDNLVEQLDLYSQHRELKGVRHILQAEKKGYITSKSFTNGISCLGDYNLTYDILIFSNQFEEAISLVSEFPDQKFVLDHIGKPPIRNNDIDSWRKAIDRISQYPNLYCKLSGFLTEADWDNWTKEQLKPYFDVVLEAFYPERLMFGSDWPVLLLAGSYGTALSIVKENIGELSLAEQEMIMSGTAIEFYDL